MNTPAARIAILGAESSGKSTLAAALAAHYRTVWVPEYLREFVATRQRTPRADEQFYIATTQIEREEEAGTRASRFVFCDTTPLMTAIYSAHYFGAVPPELEALARRHDYAATLVTAPTAPWVPDGLQRDSDTVRQHVHARLMQRLHDAGIGCLLVDGDTAQRMTQAVAWLEAAERGAQ